MNFLTSIFLFYCAFVLLVIVGGQAWLAKEPKRSPESKPWAALWRELFWTFWVQITLPIGVVFWPKSWQKKDKNDQIPTLLLHGYGQNRADFWVLGSRLRARGRGRLFAFNYWGFGAIDGIADLLRERVEAICEETGAEQLHIVAHSMGGLVSRYYIERLDGARRVRSLTALGAPLNGTERARVSPGRSCREMTPGSEFLRQLGPPNPPEGVRYHAVWSHADAVIVPAKSASLQGRGEEVVLDDCGHFSLLTRGRVASVVGLWLDEAELK